MIKDDKLICDSCSKELARIQTDGKKKLIIPPKGLPINITPELKTKNIGEAICQKCGKPTPFDLSFLGVNKQ